MSFQKVKDFLVIILWLHAQQAQYNENFQLTEINDYALYPQILDCEYIASNFVEKVAFEIV